eukprot:m.843778 g.843778  ORF g.843778 m.843778 type:complete len:70 (+) comp59538_c1_seq16:332-541(+)
MLAAFKGYAESVSCLLKHGADPSLRDMTGQTAATLALKGQHTAIAALLDQAALEHSNSLVAAHTASSPV